MLATRLLFTAAAMLCIAASPSRADGCFNDTVSGIMAFEMGLGEDASIDTERKFKLDVLIAEHPRHRRDYLANWRKGDPITVCLGPDIQTGTTHIVTNDRTHEVLQATLDGDGGRLVCPRSNAGTAICRDDRKP